MSKMNPYIPTNGEEKRRNTAMLILMRLYKLHHSIISFAESFVTCLRNKTYVYLLTFKYLAQLPGYKLKTSSVSYNLLGLAIANNLLHR